MTTLVLAFALLQDSDRDAAEMKIRSRKVTLQFKDAPLEEIVNYVRDLTDVNFVMGKGAREKGEILVSISVKELSVKSALALILKPRGLALVWQDGVFLITTPAEEPLVLEIIDVRDLLYPIQDMPGGEITLDSSSLGSSFSQDPTPEPTVLPLEEIIKTHTGKKSWEEDARTSVRLQNGLLVVKQRREVLDEVKRLINRLRRNK